SSLDINNSALTGLGNRLEQNGFIVRKPCPDDGRASRLYLTKQGKEKVGHARPLIQQLNQLMCADFNDDELKVIAKFLTHLMSNF
ncbi:MarR family winged helix-turn-helix transcriptional regulator, partial [Pseudomaricurvus sp.]|uniref:MarR family winged helix-turn-helix transcriptional regulator n=1 Tax=Pseudomaricurvus sp. TaxID=2004510 RepID=UPI003F6A53AB